MSNLPSKDALAFVIRMLYTKRNDGLESVTKRNEAMCASVADFLNEILEGMDDEEHGKTEKP
jgi:hypothetical protein